MELVVAAIAGVQRFVAEARSTADLFAGSALITELAGAMLAVVPEQSLVLPSKKPGHGTTTPNRVVVVADRGTGADLAKAMADSARSAWEKRLRDVFSNGELPPTPGFPAIQWVVVPLDDGGYQDGWARAQDVLRARKRIRDFPEYDVPQTGICALTGRWQVASIEDGSRAERLVRRGEALSAVGYVKRGYGRGRFQSTWSIATAPYRDAVIRLGDEDADIWTAAGILKSAVDDLAADAESALQAALRSTSGALRGMAVSEDETLSWLRQVEGSWCVPDTWDPASLRRDHGLAADPDPALCAAGAAAARALEQAASTAGIAQRSPYLAVLAQDADKLGERLGRFPGAFGDPVAWHRRVSLALDGVARCQVEEIESAHLGRVVYAGGDDLLALVPAQRALTAARAANELFAGDRDLSKLLEEPSASTAVVFFHASWPLQSAIGSAQALLKDAKDRDRPGLGVAVLTRGGERARVVLPWHDRTADPAVPVIAHLADLVVATSGPMSGRLAGGLEQDRDALAELSPDWLKLEFGRRARRHGIPAGQAPGVGRILASLCAGGPGGEGFTDCAASVLVARFIAAQARVSA